MTLTGVLLLSLAFVLMNGLFVAAEFALIGAPKTAIDHRAARGDKLAKRVLAILESPRQQDQYIATSQIGITIASLGLGMYGEHKLSELVEHRLGAIPVIGEAALAAIIAVGILTMLHIVLGEMLPKTVALQAAETVGRYAYWPMRTMLILFYPLVSVLTAVAGVVLRAAGVKRQKAGHEQFHTPEELALIVEESAEGGAIRADSGRLLQELFEFGDRNAAQAMTPRVRVSGIPVGATAAQVRSIISKRRHTRYPVYDGDLDHIVGTLHMKDLLRKLIADEPVSSTDARPIPVVPETTPLDDALHTMQRAHAHMAVVIDEHGGTAGVLSLEDLFEEVVGEIDEGVPQTPSLARQADGSVRAAGTARLDELGQMFDLDLEHEDVESVSGLVLARLDRSPVVGDVVDYGRIRLEVTATRGHGVREAKATLLPEVIES